MNKSFNNATLRYPFIIALAIFSLLAIESRVFALSNNSPIRKNKLKAKLSKINDITLPSKPLSSNHRLDRRAALTRLIVPPALVGIDAFRPTPALAADDGIIIVRLPSASVPSGLVFADVGTPTGAAVAIKSASITDGVAYSQKARPGMIVLGYSDKDSLMKRIESGQYPLELRLYDPNAIKKDEAPAVDQKEQSANTDGVPTSAPISEIKSLGGAPEPELEPDIPPEFDLDTESEEVTPFARKLAAEQKSGAESKPPPRTKKTESSALTQKIQETETDVTDKTMLFLPMLMKYTPLLMILVTGMAVALLTVTPKEDVCIHENWPNTVPESEKPFDAPEPVDTPPDDDAESLVESVESSLELAEPLADDLNEEYVETPPDSIEPTSEPVAEDYAETAPELVESTSEYVESADVVEVPPEPVESTSEPEITPAITYEEYMKQRQGGMYN